MQVAQAQGHMGAAAIPLVQQLTRAALQEMHIRLCCSAEWRTTAEHAACVHELFE